MRPKLNKGDLYPQCVYLQLTSSLQQTALQSRDCFLCLDDDRDRVHVAAVWEVAGRPSLEDEDIEEVEEAGQDLHTSDFLGEFVFAAPHNSTSPTSSQHLYFYSRRTTE